MKFSDVRKLIEEHIFATFNQDIAELIATNTERADTNRVINKSQVSYNILYQNPYNPEIGTHNERLDSMVIFTVLTKPGAGNKDQVDVLDELSRCMNNLKLKKVDDNSILVVRFSLGGTNSDATTAAVRYTTYAINFTAQYIIKA